MNQKIKKFQAGKSDSPIYEKTDNRATGQLKATNEQKNSRWVLNDEEGLWRKKADGTMEKYTGTEGQNPEDFRHSSAQKLIFDNAPSHLQEKRLKQLDQFGKLQDGADIIVTANGQFKDTEGHIINPNNMSRAERVALAKQAGLKGKGFLNNIFGIGRGKNLERAMDDVKDFTRTYGKNMMQYAGTSNAETPQTTLPVTATTTSTDTPGTDVSNPLTWGDVRADKGGYEYKKMTSGTGKGKDVILYRKKGEPDSEWRMTEGNGGEGDTFNNAKFGKGMEGRQAYLLDWYDRLNQGTGSGGSGDGGGKEIKTTPQSDAVKDYYNRRNNPSFTYQSNNGINTNPSGFGLNKDKTAVTHNGYENKTVLPSFDNSEITTDNVKKAIYEKQSSFKPRMNYEKFKYSKEEFDKTKKELEEIAKRKKYNQTEEGKQKLEDSQWFMPHKTFHKQGGLIFSHEQGGLVQKKSLKQEMVYLNFQDKNH